MLRSLRIIARLSLQIIFTFSLSYWGSLEEPKIIINHLLVNGNYPPSNLLEHIIEYIYV